MKLFSNNAGTLGMILISFFHYACRVAEKDIEVKRPNILFIMSDDHAFQAISAYQDRLISTPQIDRIGREGMIFRQAFVTNSICAPSRAVLLTGKHSHMNGVLDNHQTFNGDQPTFPKLLKNAGYETALIGKWHLKSVPTGFDHYQILRDQGEYYNPFFISNGDTSQVNGYVTDLITDLAVKWLSERNADQPFCLLLHHKAPHRNWMPNLKYLTRFDDREIPVPSSFYDPYETRSAAAKEQEMEIARHMRDAWDFKIRPDEPDLSQWTDQGYAWHYGKLMTEEQKKIWDAHYDPLNERYTYSKLTEKERAEWKYQRYIKDYLRCVLSIDEGVGRILDLLDKLELTDHTLVVYTSDQGFFLGEHGWFDKRFMYEESFRTPLLMRWPEGIPAGTEDTNLVQNLDFAPTFLDIAGVPVPDDMQGRSLKPLFSGNKTGKWREALYYHYYEYPAEHRVKRHYGIRTARYKLIHFYFDIDEWEFYDLQNDPAELHNEIGNPEYREKIRQLKQNLTHLQLEYMDSIR